MLKVERMTDRSKEDIGQLIRGHFGTGGLGMNLSSDAAGCLIFEGGGGYVRAIITRAGERTRLQLLTQEWEIRVKEFIGEV